MKYSKVVFIEKQSEKITFNEKDKKGLKTMSVALLKTIILSLFIQ